MQWLQNVGCLKNLGTNLWFFTSKTFFCLKAPRLCTPFDTASSPLSAILTESSSVSDCLRSLDAGPRTTSNKCYFFMHECVSKNGIATHAVSTWHLVYARIQTLLYIYSLFVDLIKVPFALLIFFMDLTLHIRKMGGGGYEWIFIKTKLPLIV